MTEQLTELEVPERGTLVKGREYTATMGTGRGRRMRFCYARLTAKGYEVTGWDGRMLRAVRIEQIKTIHRTAKIPDSPDSFKPPARRRVR
jgi:hypothetical protein